MLASDGVCCADFILVNKGDANIDVDTGEVIYIDNASILSSMVFYIDVSEVTINNSDIESSYEYDGLNSALQKAEAEYKEVIQLARSYAIGNADGIRENEDYDNAKYYYEQSLINASNAEKSEDKAKISENNAKDSEIKAKESEDNALLSEQNAKESEDKAKTSEANAKTSENNAKISEQNASASESNASVSEVNAKLSEDKASISESNANTSEINALNSATKAQSYTVGGTGTRVGEETDNASWYYSEMKDMFNGLNIVFVPKGTISFSELATAKETAVAGYLYNIKDDFVTDETFREGSGITYTAGTNIYYTIDGQWDCFGGSASPTATVDEVKDYLGI